MSDVKQERVDIRPSSTSCGGTRSAPPGCLAARAILPSRDAVIQIVEDLALGLLPGLLRDHRRPGREPPLLPRRDAGADHPRAGGAGPAGRLLRRAARLLHLRSLREDARSAVATGFLAKVPDDPAAPRERRRGGLRGRSRAQEPRRGDHRLPGDDGHHQPADRPRAARPRRAADPADHHRARPRAHRASTSTPGRGSARSSSSTTARAS